MLRFRQRSIIFLILTLFSAKSTFGQTATVGVSAINCESTSIMDNSWGFSAYGGGSDDEQTYYDSNPGNFDSLNCGSTQIKNEIDRLAEICSEYFDIISVTPLTKGAAGASYKFDNYNKSGAANGWGYSYTHSIVFTYRCL
tara:strand:- start:4800 stop:5222 length:423 start_codon:yes stop_codon:yes gene_type:complete